MGPVKYEHETELSITIHTGDEEFVGRKAKTCFGRPLQHGGYVRLYFMDQGDKVDPPMAFYWNACDTLEHLEQFTHSDVASCTAGSIMNRVNSRHAEKVH